MGFNDILKESTFKIINKIILSSPNKIIIEKNNDYENMQIKFSPTLIITNNNKDIELLSQKIKIFLIVMEKKCKNFDPTLFIQNIKKTLFYIKDLNENLVNGENGFVIYSEPILFSIKTFKAVYHEFFHLASLNNQSDKLLSCFNEGYTQLLTERYFKDSVGNGAYVFEVLIMSHIEQIIGKDYMENKFFKGKLYDLFEELYKYTTPLNIELLIFNADRLFKLENTGEIIKNKSEIQYLISQIFEILFTCFKNKLKTIDDLQERVQIYMNINWCKKLQIDSENEKINIKVLDDRLIKEGLHELFNTYSKK